MSDTARGTADVILFGGQLMTTRHCEAVALRDGHVIASGQRADVMRVTGANTKLVDLESSRLIANAGRAQGRDQRQQHRSR